MRRTAIVWFWVSLCVLLAPAQEAKITLPLGWYSAEELAQALSNEGRTVSVHAQLQQRVFLIHLRERSFDEVRELLKDGTGVRVEQTGEKRWRLEWNPDVLRREQRWRQQVAQELDKQIAENMQEVLNRIPLLSEEHFSALLRASEAYSEQIRTSEFQSLPDQYRRMLEVALDSLPLTPEVESWASKIAGLPENMRPLLFFMGNNPDLEAKADELRYRTVLLMGASQVMNYHTILAVALMYQIPSLRVSALEAMEQGMSVRSLPLSLLLERVPQLAVLKPAITAEYNRFQLPDEKKEPDLDNIQVVVRLTIENGQPHLTYSLIDPTRDLLRLSRRFPSTDRRKDPSEEPKSLADELLAFAGREGRRYGEESLKATQDALQHAQLTTEFKVPSEARSEPFSRWVYLWAKATNSEVIMLLYPLNDSQLRSERDQTRLAHLYQQRSISRTYGNLDTHNWALRMRAGVLLIENRYSFIARL